MTKIYADNRACAEHLTYFGVQQISDILDQSCQLAIFHLPYPLSVDDNFRHKLNQAVKLSNHVVILVSELHSESVEFIRQHQHPKVSYFICGFIDNLQSKFWMDWFHRSSFFYKRNPQILASLMPYTNKPKMFDILLGRNKPHRSFVYNFIRNNSYDDKVIMTYLRGNDNVPIQLQDSSGWLWEPEIVQLSNSFQWTVTSIRYHGQSMSLSQVLPLSVYNQTAYTVVCETNYDNYYSFYTEKIVKPILAERLFVVFSGQHYLRNLRSLGFKTFDGVIDESYDDIEDSNLRFTMACEQLQYLIKEPQELILEKIKSITEHNKQVMLSTDWYGDFSKELQALVLEHVKQN